MRVNVDLRLKDVPGQLIMAWSRYRSTRGT